MQLNSFLGEWNEMARTDHSFQAGWKDVIFRLTYDENLLIHVCFSFENIPYRPEFSFHATPVDLAQEEWKIDSIKILPVSARILYLGPKDKSGSYSLALVSFYKYAWVLSRKDYLTESEKRDIKKVADKYQLELKESK